MIFSVVSTLQCSPVLTQQKSGLAAHYLTQAHTQNKGWWGRKEVLSKCCTIWGNYEVPDSRSVSSTKHRQNPFIPQKTETLNRAQKSHPIVFCPFEPKPAKWIALWLPLWSQREGLALQPPCHGFFPCQGPVLGLHHSGHGACPWATWLPGPEGPALNLVSRISEKDQRFGTICTVVEDARASCGSLLGHGSPGRSPAYPTWPQHKPALTELRRGKREPVSPFPHLNLSAQPSVSSGSAQHPSQSHSFPWLDWQILL